MSGDLFGILDTFVAPELSHLTFDYMFAREWSQCRSHFECQSGYPKLRSLRLFNSCQSDVLSASPTITELDVTGDNLLKNLADSGKERSSLMVPNLISLICADLDQDMMHKLIASGKALGCPLDWVMLDAGD